MPDSSVIIVSAVLVSLLVVRTKAVDYMTVGKQKFAFERVFLVDCINTATKAKSSEVWQYTKQGLNENPTRKDKVNSKEYTEWRGKKHRATITKAGQDHGITIQICEADPNLGQLAGIMAVDIDSTARNDVLNWPCYIVNDDVPLGGGYRCKRKYQCQSIPHIVTDVTVGKDLLSNVPISEQYDALIRSSKIRDCSDATYTGGGMLLTNAGYRYKFLVDVTCSGQLGYLVNAINDNASSIAQSLLQEPQSGATSKVYVTVPTSVAITSYVGLEHANQMKYQMYLVDTTSASACESSPSPSQVASIVSSIFSFAVSLLSAAGPEGPTVAQSLGVVQGALGLVAPALSVAAGHTCS